MKGYQRLTERDEFGNADIIGLDTNELASNLDFDGLNKLTSALNQFADLEDKIESGELCDREEVRKETARTCIILAKQYQNGKKIVRDIAEKYDIDLEVEE